MRFQGVVVVIGLQCAILQLMKAELVLVDLVML